MTFRGKASNAKKREDKLCGESAGCRHRGEELGIELWSQMGYAKKLYVYCRLGWLGFNKFS